MAELGPEPGEAAGLAEEANEADATSAQALPAGSTVRRAQPLAISVALARWGRGLVVAGLVLLAAAAGVLLGVMLLLSPGAWPIDAMIGLAGLPVAVAVVWIVRRAAAGVGGEFVRAVTGTPLVAIEAPSRPPALATPAAVLRTLGLLPALVALALLAAGVAAGDALALGMDNGALRLGAVAVTCDGLVALAALLLALGLEVAALGRAVADHERTVGARFYALMLADVSAGSETGTTAVCAVPEPV
jgi:hypothetical protein